MEAVFPMVMMSGVSACIASAMCAALVLLLLNRPPSTAAGAAGATAGAAPLVAGPQNVRLRTRVNGKTMYMSTYQDCNQEGVMLAPLDESKSKVIAATKTAEPMTATWSFVRNGPPYLLRRGGSCSATQNKYLNARATPVDTDSGAFGWSEFYMSPEKITPLYLTTDNGTASAKCTKKCLLGDGATGMFMKASGNFFKLQDGRQGALRFDVVKA